jgi:Glycosyl transferase family 2
MLTDVVRDPGRLTEWPAGPTRTRTTQARVAVITVNYNTRLLIYSLFARLGSRQVATLLVVDNASTDGSRDLLERMASSGLCELIVNEEQRYHGPALNQAMNWLAERQVIAAPQESIDYVWVLDSDCVIIRGDTLSEATGALQRTGAALAGQASANQWHAEETIEMYSLMLDPSQAWRDPIPPFEDPGESSLSLQLGCAGAGLSSVEFPSTREGYVVHRGRSTLAEIFSRRETGNKHYQWAVDHHKPHFNTEPGAVDLYEAFQAEFGATCRLLGFTLIDERIECSTLVIVVARDLIQLRAGSAAPDRRRASFSLRKKAFG